MEKFVILEKVRANQYQYRMGNDEALSLLGSWLGEDISSDSERYRKWLLDSEDEWISGEYSKLVKQGEKVFIGYTPSYGEEGYGEPEFITTIRYESTVQDLLKMIDEWLKFIAKNPTMEKVLISKERDEPVKFTALTPESSYYHLQPLPYEPPSYKLPEEKFIIIGVGKEDPSYYDTVPYYWYGEDNYYGMYILAHFLIEGIMIRTRGNFECYKESLLNPEEKYFTSYICRMDKFDDKVVLHQEQERFNPAEAGEYFPYRLETTIDDMLNILDTWRKITELVHKPKKIRISQKGNQPIEFKLLYE